MIESQPPQALSLYREGCRLIECGEIAEAQRVLIEAKGLAAGRAHDAFSANLLVQIEERLASVV